MSNDYENDDLTQKIIGCCYKVHSSLGPGFIEKIYAKALQHQLTKAQAAALILKPQFALPSLWHLKY